MANLSFTVARFRDNAGTRNRRVVGYTGPASYVTGGDPLAATDVALGTIEHISDFAISNGTDFRIVSYNYTTGKLFMIVPSTNVQVANGVDLSAYTGRFEVIGT